METIHEKTGSGRNNQTEELSIAFGTKWKGVARVDKGKQAGRSAQGRQNRGDPRKQVRPITGENPKWVGGGSSNNKPAPRRG